MGIPSPSCLDRNPEKESDARGCFCPSGKLLQDGACVDPSQCKCIYEGKFYEVGDVVKKDAECKSCTCQSEGNMNCQDFTCPALSCAADEVEAKEDDSCCGHCAKDWVKAENPEVKVKKGISKDRLVLKVQNSEASDAGKYSCHAKKNGKTGSADFEVEVQTPVVPKVEVTPAKSIINCKKGKRGCKVVFKVKTTDGSKVTKKNVKICKIKNGVRSSCKRGKGKGSSFKLGIGKKAADADYVCVITLDGKEYVSDAMSVKIS